MELSIENVQITLCWNNEYAVGLNPETVRDQFDRPNLQTALTRRANDWLL